MKLATKIVHLLWAAFWCYLELWAFPTDAPWKFLVRHPFEIAKPILGLVWLVFAIGLLFERRWAWKGSMVFTILSVIAAIFIVWQTVALQLEFPHGSSLLELAGVPLLPLAVLTLLLWTRHQFFESHDNSAA
jgi:hypothetical protein